MAGGPAKGKAKPKAKGTHKVFSTTGRPVESILGQSALPQSADADQEDSESTAVVALARTESKEAEGLPARILIGAECPVSVTIGRHEENDGVLPLKRASKVHCQIALRGFRLEPDGPLHEAAFLRDNSKHGTFVNGFPAFKPWHWLQHGDVLGLLDGRPVEFCRVEYIQHETIDGHMVTPEDIPREALKPAAVLRQPPPPKLKHPYGREICGRVVDVRYAEEDPPVTYRMRVIGFLRREGFHHVDSKGLSTWDGESFDDTIDLNGMFAAGDIKFVDDAEAGAPGKKAGVHDDDEDAPLLPASKKPKAGGR